MCVYALLNHLYEFVLYNTQCCGISAQLLIDDLIQRNSECFWRC